MEISSKFSLYDILAMIIPGGVIMACVCFYMEFPEKLHCKYDEHPGNCVILCRDIPLSIAIIMLILSYLTGLVNNWIMDGIFKGFRNYDMAINKALLDTAQNNNILALKGIDGINDYINRKKRNQCLLCIVFKTLWEILKSFNLCRKVTQSRIKRIYLHVYYFLWEHKQLGAIPLIESQVVLLRNLIIPIALLIAFCSTCCNIPFRICLWLFVILMFVVMIQRQQKIYRMVWEVYNYCNYEK